MSSTRKNTTLGFRLSAENNEVASANKEMKKNGCVIYLILFQIYSVPTVIALIEDIVSLMTSVKKNQAVFAWLR